MAYPKRSFAERFWSKVNKDGPTFRQELGPCWPWTGALDKDGYGRFDMRPEGGRSSEPAFRIAFEAEYGPLELDMQPDHLCRYTLCVRPSHMEAVTAFENNSRAHRKVSM